MTHFTRRISAICLYLLPMFIFLGWFVSCKPPENNEVMLRFSTPNVNFDTVFTSVGSVTKRFTVRNTSNQEIATTIFLAGKSSSFYSINVDGEDGVFFKKVVIPKKDSIFIHVKVNIDPKNQNNPFLVTDSIVFLTGSRMQDVKLLAYGQDARYIVADKEKGYKVVAGLPIDPDTGEETGYTQEVTWTKERPYVIYGWAVIDSACSLTIEPGTKIYCHHKSGLWAYRYSYLEVNGTKDEPVLFRGDRLEKWYDDDFAQWSGIWINEGADAEINNAIITNAKTGVQINPLVTKKEITVTPNSLVKIKNTIIKNTEQCGVWSMFLNLEMTNCVIANNGASSLQLEGGKYTMKHLTIVNNYTPKTERKAPTCYVSNLVSAYSAEQDLLFDVDAKFTNCIIVGKNDTEAAVNKKGGASLSASFQNCLLKAKEHSEYFSDCFRNDDPKFEDKNKLDFRLQTGSKAIGNGKPNIGVLEDILGNIRKNPPDIGAYESQ